MNPMTLSWEDWRAVIDVLREKAVPYMLQHANVIEEQLERHGPDEAMVRLSLTDDVFPRSDTWARRRWEISLPLRARQAPKVRRREGQNADGVRGL